MKLTGKHLLIGSGVLVGGGVLIYLSKLNRLQGDLEIVTRPMIHKVNLMGIEIRVDVTLKNPTAGTIKVKYPFVKLQYKGKTIGSSEAKNRDYQVPKFGEVGLEPIALKLTYLNLAMTAPDLLKTYRSEGKLNLSVVTVTTINNTLPYSKTEAIEL